MRNHNDKYPARPGFEPGTLQAPVDTKEPSRLTGREVVGDQETNQLLNSSFLFNYVILPC